jgi:hypothetical protein
MLGGSAQRSSTATQHGCVVLTQLQHPLTQEQQERWQQHLTHQHTSSCRPAHLHHTLQLQSVPSVHSLGKCTLPQQMLL